MQTTVAIEVDTLTVNGDNLMAQLKKQGTINVEYDDTELKEHCATTYATKTELNEVKDSIPEDVNVDINLEEAYHTHTAGQITNLKSTLLDMFYPIGSIYTSMSSTSPATLFGGTWEQKTDIFNNESVYAWYRTA